MSVIIFLHGQKCQKIKKYKTIVFPSELTEKIKTIKCDEP